MYLNMSSEAMAYINQNALEMGIHFTFVFNPIILACAGPAPGWHLDYIDVRDETMDKTFRFPCDRWLAKNDDDGQIMRELACANNDILDLNEKTSKAQPTPSQELT